MLSVTQTQTPTKFQCGFPAFVKSQGLKPIKCTISVFGLVNGSRQPGSEIKRQNKEAKKETF